MDGKQRTMNAELIRRVNKIVDSGGENLTVAASDVRYLCILAGQLFRKETCGFENWETFTLYMDMTDSQESQTMLREVATAIILGHWASTSTVWTLAESQRYAMADAIHDHYDTIVDVIESNNNPGDPTWPTSILRANIGKDCVNYNELADALLDDVRDTMADDDYAVSE